MPSLSQAVKISPAVKNKSVHGVKTIMVGLAIVAGGFTTISYQDMQVRKSASERWLVHLPIVEEKSTLPILDPEVDQIKTGSVLAMGMEDLRDGLEEIIAPMADPVFEIDPVTKINRRLKGDRVVASIAKTLLKQFSAGVIVRRESLFSPLGADKKQSQAFVKAKPSQEAFKIAAAFQYLDQKENRELAKLPILVASLVRESKSSILAYSAEDSVKYSPFAAVLRDEGPISIIPKLNDYDHSWADDPLPKSSFSDKQQKCLANGIYFEARGEPVRGQAAVAQVILNRVRNPAYPNTICQVVYQNKRLRNRCQFSFACDRIRDRISDQRLWNLALQVAKETTAGRIWLTQVGSSTHYHAVYVRPKWAKQMKKVGRIGLHVFYRTKGGGWS